MKIKTTKPSHKIIAVFLTLNFLTTLLPTNLMYASNNGPNAPEAASFEPVDATDMVNLATGDFSYVLPLLNVPSPEGGYPLALSYHAGIGLDQEASWVGLGWNINPGAINRSVSGVPDDWLETKKYSMLYNNIGVAKSISLGVSARNEVLSLSASLNYSSFKATGGETSYDFGATGSIGITGIGSANGYIGTNGLGLGVSTDDRSQRGSFFSLNAEASLFQSFKGNGLNSNMNVGIGQSYFGTGFSLSSDDSLSSSLSIGSNNFLSNGGNNLSGSIHSDVSGFAFRFPLPIPGTTLDFSYRKTKFWAFDANYSVYNGALYAGKIEDTYQNLIDPAQLGLDFYEALYKSDTNEQQRNSNFSFVSYDNYSISAQGIGGTLSPKLLEEGALIMPRTTLRTVTSKSGRYHTSVTNALYIKPNDEFKNFSKSIDQQNVHFYFENEYTSYLKIGSGNWSSPQKQINYDDPTEFFTMGKVFDDSVQIDGESFDSYNEQNERLKKGRYIETYTNEEINGSESLIIKPIATGFNRNSAYVPEKGIGAFKVTALDGKTYHYSLPVYHKEKFSRVSNFEDDSEDKFLEQQQFSPYATHWLLTAVTGPDYIDKNGNNFVDEQDYGYWVGFEYGKWSDGFAWRSPNFGSHSDGNTKTYAWGIKELYYLDKVKTRTHTALFIKDVRKDNLSYSTQISNDDNAKHYHIPFERGVLPGVNDNKGNYYFQGTHLDIELWRFPYHDYYSTSDFWFYAELERQKSLRLEKIILLKNSDAENVLKHNNIDNNSSFGGRLSAEARISVIWNGNGATVDSRTEELAPDNSWYGEYFNNVLNTNDIDFESLTPKTIKTINFEYDETYPLGRETFLNLIELTGKLTLDSVTTLGNGGEQLIPPYEFDYYGENTTFDKNDLDDWGYFKNQAMMWSLNRITTPLGGEIEVTYENDRYVNEYAKPTTYFDHGLELKFGGTYAGQKTLSFRNNPDVLEKYHVDFTEYFEEGESTEIDVLFWHYTNTKSNWVGDFATENCMVQTVSSDLLVFSLPVKNQQWGRENQNCTKKDWVFYDKEYSHVVAQSAGWVQETNENSCERPGKGTHRSRYRIFAQKEPLNIAEGGGIRIKKLELTSDSYNTKTVYKYTDSDNMESGVTSYAPSKMDRVIPYISELPNPMVIYEHVTTERLNAKANIVGKKSYQFNVPKTLQYTQDGVLVENAFEITMPQNIAYIDVSLNNDDVDMYFSKYEVKDYSSSIGRLVEAVEYNSENQQIYKIENSYLSESHDFKQGVLQESFNSYKRLKDSPNKVKYLMTSSSKQKIPNILSQTSITKNGSTYKEEMSTFDFLTGQVTESQSLMSDGKLLKTKMYPAYLKYPQMGSKVDNVHNKNMLTQEAMTIAEIQNENAGWEKIGANVTTWNPETYSVTTFVGEFPNEIEFTQYYDVWRKHKTFTWDGDTNSDGYFTNYSDDDDGFDWSGPNVSQPNQWKQLSEITQYNNFSSPLEVKDVNANLAATKMGYNDTKTIAVCNAGYQETYYSGAEDHDGQGRFGGGVQKGTAMDTNDAHTGDHALSIGNGQNAYRVTVRHNNNAAKKYKMSLWAKNGNHADVRINVGGNTIEHNAAEELVAGDWVQLNFYADINSGTSVHVTTANGGVIVDDFRVHPISASMNSYVYNQWDELTDILGPNNLATRYEYDAGGRLLRIYSEVINVNGIVPGGFKKIKEYAYTYKGMAFYNENNNQNNQLQLNLGLDNHILDDTSVLTYVSGGSGQYEYQWSVKYCNDPEPQDATVCPGDLEPTYGGWGNQNTQAITTDCMGQRAVYWCRVRDMVTQNIAEDQGNHRRGSCGGEELPQE